MTTDDILEVAVYVVLILSGAVLFEILLGRKKSSDIQDKVDRILRNAERSAYDKMREKYPKISHR